MKFENVNIIVEEKVGCVLCQHPKFKKDNEANEVIYSREHEWSELAEVILQEHKIKIHPKEIQFHYMHLKAIPIDSSEAGKIKDERIKNFLDKQLELLGYNKGSKDIEFDDDEQIDLTIRKLAAQAVDLELKGMEHSREYSQKIEDLRKWIETKKKFTQGEKLVVEGKIDMVNFLTELRGEKNSGEDKDTSKGKD